MQHSWFMYDLFRKSDVQLSNTGWERSYDTLYFPFSLRFWFEKLFLIFSPSPPSTFAFLWSNPNARRSKKQTLQSGIFPEIIIKSHLLRNRQGVTGRPFSPNRTWNERWRNRPREKWGKSRHTQKPPAARAFRCFHSRYSTPKVAARWDYRAPPAENQGLFYKRVSSF